MMKAPVFDIQRFSIGNGPGVRTTVFLKGCPLRCKWCHNPESWRKEPQILYFRDKCIGCMACVAVCSSGAQQIRDGFHFMEEGRCTQCGKCSAACPRKALVRYGSDYTAEEVIEVVLKDRVYYTCSGGGVTFSGGEPTGYTAFVKAVFTELKKEGIHCALDTCGSARWENLAELLEVTDLFLYDIKHMDESRHKKLTGKGNREILNNLTQLEKAGASIWVRYPMIPGANDTAENLAAMAEWLKSRNITSLELLPYHRLGEEKTKALQNAVPFSPPNKEQLENAIAFLKKQGICVYYFGT